ncbi:MAG: phosphate acyltransferase PlsX [Candidatus Omnitrophica bacterium]|nr:phosphate acyltransferase PlsX [Candidatus Omnitrophota bacterium]MBU1995912.1 phosphate acyltransferase PlsX [Candidatus Omnitrophota bacterium]MBU4334024.1 phosphate acyltransferase PlsX [Candidatus Omnitrophota bacterium]
MKIVVDAMGGDYAPKAIVEGVIDAINEFSVNIVLVGDQEAIEKELANYKYPKDKIEIVHTDEAIGMNEPATTSIRKKKNSSISVGIKLLKEPGYNAFVSAGNTGAVVAASTIFLGMMDGVERPAIGLVIPTLKKFAFLIDVGANTEPKSQHLVQSAQMARVYAREVLGVQDPKVGLVNIGSEETKGTGFEKETYKMMEEKVTNFVGNVEANEVFSGKSDCIVCNGFVGNIIIKTSEGLMESAATLLRREIKKSPIALLGALLMKSRLNHIKKHADYSEYGGAPLLGVNGVVMISHGRSSPKAIKNAIKATISEVEHNIIESMVKEISG